MQKSRDSSQTQLPSDCFEKAFDLAPTAVAIVRHQDGVVLAANAAFLALVGRSRQEVIGISLSALELALGSAAFERMLAELPTSGSVRDFVWHRDVGAEISCCFEGTFEMLEGGSDAYFLADIRDASDRDRLDEKLCLHQESERKRLRVELHDGLCQELAALIFMVEVLRRKLADFPEVSAALNSRAARICDTATRAVHDTHALADSLFPDELDEADLAQILEQLATDTARLHRIQCLFKSGGSAISIDSSSTIHLYRIIQECLRNAIAERGATQIHIELELGEKALLVTLTDNGRKSEGSELSESRIFSHRLRLLNAAFRSSPGESNGEIMTISFSPPAVGDAS